MDTDNGKNGKKRKNKPEGTKTTRKGRNKSEKKVSRKNRPIPNSKSKGRIDRVNSRRKDEAIKAGNVRTVKSIRTVSPAREEEVSPASVKKVSSTKYVPVDERRGDSKAYGKELPAGKKPSSKGSGRGARLQKALDEGRKNKKETITFEGREYAAGKNVTTTKEVNIPAKTRKIPAVTKTTEKEVVDYEKKVAKPKRKRSRVKRAKSVNARSLKNITVTGTK